MIATKALSLCCLLLAIGPTPRAAALEIKGGGTIAPGKMARLEAAGAPGDAALIWDFDEDALDAEESGLKLFVVGSPGTYKIKVRSLVVKDGKTTIQTARTEVTFASPPAPKPPDPPPIPPTPVPPVPVPPTPDPTPPVVGKLWAIAVIDNDARTPALAKVLGDRKAWKDIEGLGHRWRVMSSKSAVVKDKGYLVQATKVGLPALLLLTKEGRLIKAIKFPDTSEALLNAVKGAKEASK